MKTDVLMAALESDAFAYRVNYASGLRHFRRLAERSLEFLGLVESVRQDDEVGREVAVRAIALIREASESVTEHPNDAAVAAYLLVLDRAPSKWAGIAAAFAETMQRGWWAPRVAEQIHERASVRSSLSEKDLVLPIAIHSFVTSQVTEALHCDTNVPLAWAAESQLIRDVWVELKTPASGSIHKEIPSARPSLETYLKAVVGTDSSQTSTLKVPA